MNWTGRHWPTRSELLRSKNAFFHAFNRGVDRQTLFFDEGFYRLFLGLTTAALQDAGLRLLAYCLMPNHFHLLFRQDSAFALSVFMEHVCSEYAKAVNGIRARTGHLFQRRYGIKWAWDEQTLPHLANYIHLNPVKGGLVKRAEEWEFSSCQDYCGLRPAGIIDTSDVLSRLDGSKSYRTFMEENADLALPIPRRCLFNEEGLTTRRN